MKKLLCILMLSLSTFASSADVEYKSKVVLNDDVCEKYYKQQSCLQEVEILNFFVNLSHENQIEFLETVQKHGANNVLMFY